MGFFNGENDKTTLDKVKEIICEQVGGSTDELSIYSDIIEDCSADVYDVMEIVMAIENEFNIEFSDEDSKKMRSVKDFVDAIKKSV